MELYEFRAWDKFNAEMVYSNTFESLSKFFADIEMREMGGNDIALMRFTGLKAENDIKIFEKDILESTNPVHAAHGRIKIKVVWCEDENGWSFKKGLLLYEMNVIGNVYQNPEWKNRHGTL